MNAHDEVLGISYYWADTTLRNGLIYSYDLGGNVKTVNQGYYSTTYVYDGADQLMSETSTGSYPPPTVGYTYDKNGNRLTQTKNGQPLQSFTYDAHDKLTSGTSGNETDTYDLNGSETSTTISGVTYRETYDDEDRLTSIVVPNVGTDSFTYNGLGLRVGKSDSTGTYSYLCDGASPGSSVLYDGHAVYTPGESETRNGTSAYYSNDRLGNLWTLDGTTKNQLTYEDFTGFGSVTAGASGQTPFGYGGGNGCQTDADTGLVLMGHRYYDTRIGRFITQDPAGNGRNKYTYADNNPTDEIDPSGLITQQEAQEGSAAYNAGDPGVYDFWQVTNGDYKNAKYLYSVVVGDASLSGASGFVGSNVMNLPHGSSDLLNNIQAARTEYNRTRPVGFGDPFLQAYIDAKSIADRYKWFYDKVHGKGGGVQGGSWDIKEGVDQTKDPLLWALRDNGGNFNYGAAGAAGGFGDQTLLYGGGLGQAKDIGLQDALSHWTTHFDDPEGQAEIRAGIAWYNAGAHTYSMSVSF